MDDAYVMNTIRKILVFCVTVNVVGTLLTMLLSNISSLPSLSSIRSKSATEASTRPCTVIVYVPGNKVILLSVLVDTDCSVIDLFRVYSALPMVWLTCKVLLVPEVWVFEEYTKLSVSYPLTLGYIGNNGVGVPFCIVYPSIIPDRPVGTATVSVVAVSIIYQIIIIS